jgi:FtsP/CotA-like multicopper oxidase with cupredoxin domain
MCVFPILKLTVVAADGQDVEPVTVDEFRIGTAETYDVVVEPREDRAYTIFAQSIDRTGYACGTLASREGMKAKVPALDPVPTLTMVDMVGAMVQGGHAMTGMQGTKDVRHGSMPGMNHGAMQEMPGMEQGSMSSGMSAMPKAQPV